MTDQPDTRTYLAPPGKGKSDGAGRTASDTPVPPAETDAANEEWRPLPRLPHSSLEAGGDVVTIPERYSVRKSDDGRFLHCEEAPRVRVVIDRKLSVSESEARGLGKRVIFLDGAGDFPPTLDNKARIYNLDHHQGCIRPFTLASCEQALVLVLSGLELDEGDWTVYANEPDLDTVLAIWVLLNFRRIPKLRPYSRDILLPLLRLEGAIDANGSELSEFCGLPQIALLRARERLDTLFAFEKEARAQEQWPNVDWREYTAVMLGKVDHLVYTRSDFQEYASIGEILGHIEIGRRKVAVACRDQAGIYEAERSLKTRWGEQLGIIALEKSEGSGHHHYTLRRTSAVLDFDLSKVYDRLNLLDPAVDGRPASKRWGGSDDIGGSPRPEGSLLAPSELLRTLKLTYQKSSRRERAWPFVGAAIMSALLMIVGGAAALFAAVVPEMRFGVLEYLTNGGAGLIGFSLVSIVLAASLTAKLSQGRSWLFGWRTPAGWDWLTLAPIVLASALPATVFIPRNVPTDSTAYACAAGVVALATLASEAWFRGAIHGWFIFRSPVQRVSGPWFLSRANIVSTLLYTLTCVAISLAWHSNQLAPGDDPLSDVAITAGAALLGGAALGAIRERSLSLLPGFVLQFVGGLAGAFFMLGSN
jgi:hypothetical protein